MAEIPQYGRKIGAPGPVGYNPGTGPLWDTGLKVIADMTGDAAGAVAEKRLRIQRAREATEIIGRTSQFSLGMANVFQQASKLPTAAEREMFYAKETEKLRQAALDWSDGSPEAKTDLLDTITGQFTRNQIAFLQEQERLELKNIADQASFAIDTAVKTGDEALLMKSADELLDAGIITPAKREQIVAEFPMDVRIEQLRQKANADPDGIMDEAVRLQSDASATDTQRTRLREVEKLARGIGIDRRRQQDLAIHGLREDAFRQAHEITADEFQQRLLQTVGITEEQRADLMHTYLSAAQLYQRTGSDPWTKTMDHATLAQTRIKVRDGAIKSYAEIDSAWMEGGRPNWSYNDWLSVTNLFEERNKPRDGKAYSPSHPAAAVYFDKLGAMHAAGTIDDRTYNEKQFLLENALSDPKVWRNSEEMQKSWDGLMKEEIEKQAKTFVKRASEAMSFMPAPMFMPPDKTPQYLESQARMAGPGDIDNNAAIAGRIARELGVIAKPDGTQLPVFEPGDVTVLTAHEDAAKLPKGTRYVLPNDLNVYEVQ